MKILYSDRFLEYREQGHPESPERLKVIVDFLRRKGITEFTVPNPCEEKEILAVHSEELVYKVRESNFFDPDTPNIKGIYDYALLSAGSAIMASDFAESGEIAFSLARPPGHHAGRDFLQGFCYFNNMAIAASNLLKKNKKVAILDIDGHHGNGTEDIFRNAENVIYLSIHQYPAYPGTGAVSFGNCYNFPVPPGTGSKKYLEKLSEALKIIKQFSPDVVGISLGLDSHSHDPLLQLELSDSDYYFIGKELSKFSSNLFVLLEGGYNVKVIGNSFYCFLNGVSVHNKKVSTQQ